MSRAIVVGSDEEELTPALEEVGFETTRIDGPATRDDLEECDITEASVLVVTDIGQATTIPVAREIAPDIRIVVYDRQSLPEFVAGVTDLAVDPALVDPDVVAEELAEDS